MESAILDTLDRGGRMILYGPIRRAGKRLLDLLGLRVGDPVSGEGEVAMPSTLDCVRDGATGGTVIHRALVSGGPVCAEPSARGGPDHLLVNASFSGRHRALRVVGCTGTTAGYESRCMLR